MATASVTKWQVVLDGGNTWTDISGATGSTYTLECRCTGSSIRKSIPCHCIQQLQQHGRYIFPPPYLENQAGITQQPASQGESASTQPSLFQLHRQHITQANGRGKYGWWQSPGRISPAPIMRALPFPSVTESMNSTLQGCGYPTAPALGNFQWV